MEREEYASCCDCCGELKTDCLDQVWRGMDVHICPACRGVEEDETADRDDWKFHQEHDQ